MEKIWNDNFIEYMKFIINHPNYKGLPILKKIDGTYSWIATAKSEIGKGRIQWAKSKMKELDIKDTDNSPYAKLMFMIHPTKEKVCQICGKKMSLYYVYLNKPFIKSIQKNFKYTAEQTQSIYDVCKDLKKLGHSENKIIDFLEYSFSLKHNYVSLESALIACEKLCRNGNCKKLGPGAMSNFPDRFDGFHTYNRCCRTKEDTGRSPKNLRTYNKDRRAYEYWSDGNIHAANTYMKSPFFIGTSADHVGPISLGFVHDSHYLRSLSTGENSSKRDKLTDEDITAIIEIENNTNIPAMSWFALKIWKYIKANYKSTPENIPIYRDILKQNMANFMFILSYIHNIAKKKGTDFLINSFLQPKFEYFNYNYIFDSNGKIVRKNKRNKTDASKYEIDRYIRIAFESVNDYHKKENRHLSDSIEPNDIKVLNHICQMIKNNDNPLKIKSTLEELMINLQVKLIAKNL